MKAVLVSVTAAALLAHVAHADTVAFDNFGSGLGYNPDLPAAAVRGPQSSNWAHGIPFVAMVSGTVSSMDLALFHTNGPNDFIVRIQADDAGGTPGTVLGEWFGVQAFTTLGDPPVTVQAGSTVVEIAEGTRYWMVTWATGNAQGQWHETTVFDPGQRAWGRDGVSNWSLHNLDHPWAFRVKVEGSDPCYANCDGSTTEPVLTVNDFTCFINEFASAQTLPPSQQIEHYANCDGSTTEPVLTVNDFTCFINEFAQGCP